MRDECYQCFGFNRCLTAAINDAATRCVYFKQLKMRYDETVDKLNESCSTNQLSEEELKELVAKGAAIKEIRAVQNEDGTYKITITQMRIKESIRWNLKMVDETISVAEIGRGMIEIRGPEDKGSGDIATTEPVQIFCEEDFVRMVDERLGRDAGGYINNIIEQRNDAIKERDEALDKPGYDAGYDEGYSDGLADGERVGGHEAYD